jgi:GMP synthase-like glutamine amidotransferase
MRIHCLQHVDFEGLGSMEAFFIQRGHCLSATHLYRNQALPELSALDWLIIMGGPMGVGDDARYPWMAKEKAFIKAAIEGGTIVLGICLGAQLIADALGAKVYRNPCREIGWFPVYKTAQTQATILKDVIPSGLTVFHWHGDTFDIPQGGVALASSDACRNQGFIVANRVVGLQFHLETTPDSVHALVQNCGHELDGSRFVQDKEAILARRAHCADMNTVMVALLEKLEATAGSMCEHRPR